VTRVPLVATAPDHAQLPLAVQEVASVLDQVMVELAPEEIVEGLNAMIAVGVGVAAFTLRAPAPMTPMVSSSTHRIAHHVLTLMLMLSRPIANRRETKILDGIRNTIRDSTVVAPEQSRIFRGVKIRAKCAYNDPCNSAHLALPSDELCGQLKFDSTVVRYSNSPRSTPEGASYVKTTLAVPFHDSSYIHSALVNLNCRSSFKDRGPYTFHNVRILWLHLMMIEMPDWERMTGGAIGANAARVTCTRQIPK
jgi:hypothetical protein